MSRGYKSISGAILAGGRSKRMGFQKSNILVKGERIIDITLKLLQTFFDEILIIADDRKQIGQIKGANVVEDLVKGCGPLGGIYTGLRAISNEQALFVACDMPFLRQDLIKRLLSIAKKEDYDAIVPSTSRGIEPLHAVYSKKNLKILEDLLKGENFSISGLLNRCQCKYLKVNQAEESLFFNLNTPEDLKKVIANEK